MADPVTGLTPAPADGQQPFSFAAAPTAPGFDVIEILPEGAPQDRLRALRQRSLDLHALMPPFEDVRTASMARIEAASALKRLTAHPQEFGFNLKPDDRRVIAATKALDKATDELQRIKDRSEARSAAWQAVGRVLQAVETWLRDGRPSGTVLHDFDGPAPKLVKNEDVLSGIERLRRRARELKADLHRIESAPYPSSHAKAKMREQIEALSMQGVPVVSDVVEHDRQIIWPTKTVRSEVFGGTERSLASAQVPDALALTCWLHKDALIKRLDAEIDAEADDKAALTHEARQKAEAEVMGDLLSVERDEAALTWRAIDDKLPVEFRSDINPIAVLQVQLVTVPRADVSGTSATHAYDIVGPGRR